MHPALERRDRRLAVREGRHAHPERVELVSVEQLVPVFVHRSTRGRELLCACAVDVADGDELRVVPFRERRDVVRRDPAGADEPDPEHRPTLRVRPQGHS